MELLIDALKLWNVSVFALYLVVPVVVMLGAWVWLTIRPQDKARLDAWLDKQDAKKHQVR